MANNPRLPPASIAVPQDQLATTRESMLTEALVGTRSSAQAEHHVAQYFETRHAAAESRALDAERLAAERAVHLERAETQLEAVRRFNGPSIGFQAASLVLAALGGWQLTLPGAAGLLLVGASAASYVMGTWMQKRIVTPTR